MCKIFLKIQQKLEFQSKKNWINDTPSLFDIVSEPKHNRFNDNHKYTLALSSIQFLLKTIQEPEWSL